MNIQQSSPASQFVRQKTSILPESENEPRGSSRFWNSSLRIFFLQFPAVVKKGRLKNRLWQIDITHYTLPANKKVTASGKTISLTLSSPQLSLLLASLSGEETAPEEIAHKELQRKEKKSEKVDIVRRETIRTPPAADRRKWDKIERSHKSDRKTKSLLEIERSLIDQFLLTLFSSTLLASPEFVQTLSWNGRS